MLHASSRVSIPSAKNYGKANEFGLGCLEKGRATENGGDGGTDATWGDPYMTPHLKSHC